MNWAFKSSQPPPGYRYGPRYRPSLGNVLRGLYYIARGKPRSLAHDLLYALVNVKVPPLVRGEDNIPDHGPFVLVANHYERAGLWMAWPAMIAAHFIREHTGEDTHWVAIEEWETLSVLGITIPSNFIRTVFERAFATYGIIAMPAPSAPMPARAAAMRAVAREVRHGAIVGLMPEGTIGPTPELLPAREGVGSFIQLLATSGTPILPMGLYEEDDHLIVHFGCPITLDVPKGMSREESDAWVRDRMMLAIRALLPQPLWGAYREPAGREAV